MARRTKFQGSAPLMEKKSFIKTGEQVIASYNHTDIEDGTGIVVFYAGGLKNKDGEFFRIDKDKFNPWYVFSGCDGDGNYINKSGREKRFSTNNTNFTTAHNLNFETTEFATPRIIGGKMLVDIPFAAWTITASEMTTKSTVTVSIIRDGSPIEIGENNVEYDFGDNNNTVKNGRYSFFVDLTKTPIKIDDILRVNVHIEIKRRSYDRAVAHAIFIDPMGREAVATSYSAGYDEELAVPDNDAGETTTKFHIPFKIDI